MDIVAERRIVAVFANGTTTPVCLRVGKPVPHPEGDWVCPVQADGLQVWEGATNFMGVDSWQALTLGLRFLRSMLTLEAERGAVFRWEEGEETISVDELFALHKIG